MFLSGWLGGPDRSCSNSPPDAARHLPFPVDEGARDQWLYCMYKAMQGNTDAGRTARERLEQSFFNTADFMRNQD